MAVPARQASGGKESESDSSTTKASYDDGFLDRHKDMVKTFHQDMFDSGKGGKGGS